MSLLATCCHLSFVRLATHRQYSSTNAATVGMGTRRHWLASTTCRSHLAKNQLAMSRCVGIPFGNLHCLWDSFAYILRVVTCFALKRKTARQPQVHRDPSPLIEPTRVSDRPIAMEMDLCLFRAVADCCGNRILPFGVRQMIKEYAWVSFDNETLRVAVTLWCTDRVSALRRYGDINDWNVRRVTNMAGLFAYTSFNDRIDRWDVSHVTSMKHMFFFTQQFNQPLETWDVSHVKTMLGMFWDAPSFNQPLSSWDVGAVTDMRLMFRRASKFNGSLVAWNVGQVIDMESMFMEAHAFNQPLHTWDVCHVRCMDYMFYNAWSFNQSLETCRVSPDTSMIRMFADAESGRRTLLMRR